jgi:hypothetical protein
MLKDNCFMVEKSMPVSHSSVDMPTANPLNPVGLETPEELARIFDIKQPGLDVFASRS